MLAIAVTSQFGHLGELLGTFFGQGTDWSLLGGRGLGFRHATLLGGYGIVPGRKRGDGSRHRGR